MGGIVPYVLSNFSGQIVDDAGAAAATIKLPEGIYSSVFVRLSGTGGSGSVALNTDPTLINRMRIKKGAQYIVDATGTQLRALARHKSGTIPTVANNAGAYSELVVGHYFGRQPRDKVGLFVAGKNSQIELVFGTLIAATGLATGTVTITVYGDMWVGPLPPTCKGALGCLEVADIATGTLRVVQDLHRGRKVSGFLIEVATITTVRQVRFANRNMNPLIAEQEWRDILNHDNYSNDKETAETTWAVWMFYNKWNDQLDDLPDTNLLTDPVLIIERGATTTVTGIIQLDLFENF